MKRYFTSDLHLGSKLINKYAHRPWTNAKSAYEALRNNIWEVVDPNATLIHCGDFLLSGADRHGTEEDVGLDISQEEYVKSIGTRLFLLSGNHDDAHNGDTDAKSLILDLNQRWRNVYVNHFPSDHKFYHGPRASRSSDRIFINLCGHVHDAWLLKWDRKNGVVNVNVGIDVWDYKPVSDVQITKMLDYLWNGKVRAPDVMTRKQYEEWVEKNEKQVKLEREVRKAEKHKKKGLTPEICQQRKEEALKKKGLLK